MHSATAPNGPQSIPSTVTPAGEDKTSPAGWHIRQGTLARELTIQGRGLHTGRICRLRILPAPPDFNKGILFRRIQGATVLGELGASVALWYHQPRCSTLRSKEGLLVRTVEHILAALLMCEIDHAIVELDDEEIPILDGGSRTWIKALHDCGRIDLPFPKRFIRVIKHVEKDYRNNRRYAVDPYPGFAVDIHTEPIEHFGSMHWCGEVNPLNFGAEIAPSRSYGKIKWALPLMLHTLFTKKPLLRGARLSCVAPILHKWVLGGMTVKNEFARHRVLDMIGDFALAGAPVLGTFTVRQSSHFRNQDFIKHLLRTKDAWEWAEFV